MKMATMMIASALLAAPAAFAGSQALNDDSAYGICTAYEASETGREHGNASQAPPFQALKDAAGNETVASHCEDVDHPADEHRPEDPSAKAEEHKPEDPGRADEHRPDDRGRSGQERGRA